MAIHNLVLEYMERNDCSLRQARIDLIALGADCASAIDLLNRLQFDHSYIMDALEFIPQYNDGQIGVEK